MELIANPTARADRQEHLERANDAAIERLCDGIRKALVVDRQQVTVGDLTLRFLRRNEVFSHQGSEYQALEPGLFQLATWTRSAPGKQEETGSRWIHYASSDDLEAILTPRLRAMSANEAEGIRVGLAAQKVLRDINTRRRTWTP
ncbi:MAG: hypothetical protein O9327_03430 [Polaromonas sp.]|nr:hypothetical protein [Polaromonas sp.]